MMGFAEWVFFEVDTLKMLNTPKKTLFEEYIQSLKQPKKD